MPLYKLICIMRTIVMCGWTSLTINFRLNLTITFVDDDRDLEDVEIEKKRKIWKLKFIDFHSINQTCLNHDTMA